EPAHFDSVVPIVRWLVPRGTFGNDGPAIEILSCAIGRPIWLLRRNRGRPGVVVMRPDGRTSNSGSLLLAVAVPGAKWPITWVPAVHWPPRSRSENFRASNRGQDAAGCSNLLSVFGQWS